MIRRYNFLKYTFKPFENWKLRMGTYGGVGLNQSMPFSVPVSTLLSLQRNVYRFSLHCRLRSVGLNALNCVITIRYLPEN